MELGEDSNQTGRASASSISYATFYVAYMNLELLPFELKHLAWITAYSVGHVFVDPYISHVQRGRGGMSVHCCSA